MTTAKNTRDGGGAQPQFIVPFLRHPGFVGREEDLAKIHALLQKGEAVGVRPVEAFGMGGIGKTQIAVEYAYRYKDDYPGGVYWVNAAGGVQAEMAARAEKVGLFEDDAPDAERLQRRVLAMVGFLDARLDALVIFDNVENPRSLRDLTFGFMPAQLKCRMLFTTRRRDGSGAFASVLVGALSDEEALKVLTGAAEPSRDGSAREAAMEIHAMLNYCAVVPGADWRIVAGDRAGALHILDWLPPGASAPSRTTAPRRPTPLASTRPSAHSATKHAPSEPTAMSLQVSGSDYEHLTTALVKAFPSQSRLEKMLQFRLRKDLNEIAAENLRLDDAVFEVIRSANAEGWTLQLVSAARASNPGNPQLFVFCQALGLAPATPAQLDLERLVARTNSLLDLNQWRTRLGEIEAQVCRIELGRGTPKSFGTGFLVGPDLVITNHHVLASVIDGKLDPAEVILRFDYKRLAGGNVVNPGTEHVLAKDWLIDHSPPDAADVGDADPTDLDYALVRVAGRPGEEPVGRGAEPGAPKRRWIIPKATHDFAPHTPLFIVQHPRAEPIQLALDTDAVVSLNGNGTRVRYRTNTEPGSSGSPCFDQSWALVALHHAGDPDFSFGHAATHNAGIPFARIVAHLRRPGVEVELPSLPE